jgi:hypothetical protein
MPTPKLLASVTAARMLGATVYLKNCRFIPKDEKADKYGWVPCVVLDLPAGDRTYIDVTDRQWKRLEKSGFCVFMDLDTDTEL